MKGHRIFKPGEDGDEALRNSKFKTQKNRKGKEKKCEPSRAWRESLWKWEWSPAWIPAPWVAGEASEP